MLHRDLKPENVLVTADGVPVIADFETSTAPSSAVASTLTVTRLVVSGAYSAPELFTDGHSEATDMYAYGVLLGQLLVGPHTTPSDMVKALRECSPVSDPGNRVKVAASCLAGLEQAELELVELLLSPDPRARPSAAQLLRMPFFVAQPQIRSCVICLGDDIPLTDGLACAGGGREGARRGGLLQLTLSEMLRLLLATSTSPARTASPTSWPANQERRCT